MPTKLGPQAEQKRVSFAKLNAALVQAFKDYHADQATAKPKNLNTELAEMANVAINTLLEALQPVMTEPDQKPPKLSAAITLPYLGTTAEGRLEALADLMYYEGLSYGQATAQVTTDDGDMVFALGETKKATHITLNDVSEAWGTVMIRLGQLQSGVLQPNSIQTDMPPMDMTPTQVGEWLKKHVYLESATNKVHAEMGGKLCKPEIEMALNEIEIMKPLLSAWTGGQL